MRSPRACPFAREWTSIVRGLLFCGLVACGLVACGGGSPGGDSPRGDAAATAGGENDTPVTAAVGDAPAAALQQGEDAADPEAISDEDEPTYLSDRNRRAVTLYFQDPNSDSLLPEERQIFETNSLTDQAKQIVVGLIDGPRNPNLLPTIPAKTRVLGLYMDRYGTAWIDLSHELASDHPGGTAEELATIFSLVNSLTVSLPAIKRVHLLVDGEERDTLNSHLDLRRDFVQDLSIVHGNDE